jgi:hypothetical protein
VKYEIDKENPTPLSQVAYIPVADCVSAMFFRFPGNILKTDL